MHRWPVRLMRATPHLLVGVGAAWNLLVNLEASRPLRGAIGWAGIVWQIGICVSQLAIFYWTIPAPRIKYLTVLAIHHIAGATLMAGYFIGLVTLPREVPWWQGVSTATGLAAAAVCWHALRYYQITRDELPTLRAIIDLQAAQDQRP